MRSSFWLPLTQPETPPNKMAGWDRPPELESGGPAMPDPARPGPDADPGTPSDAESTLQLLERAHAGDDAALETLFARYLKPLQRWASGRLPVWARSAADTHDLWRRQRGYGCVRWIKKDTRKSP